MHVAPRFCFPFDPLCGGSGALHSIVTTVLSAICGWIASGAAWFLTQIGTAITQSTSLTLKAQWFVVHYQTMLSLAAVLAVPFLCGAAIQSILRAQPSIIVRAAFIELPIAGLLSGVGVGVVQLLVHVTDSISTTLAGGTGGTLLTFLNASAQQFSNEAGFGSLGAPLPVVFVASVLVIAGGFALWLELLVRSAAIAVAVLFLPLALIASMWPAISHWSRRLIDGIVGIVVAKVVIVAVLALALSALAKPSGQSSMLVAAALLALAAFSPFVLLRLVPAIEAGAALALESARVRTQGQVVATTTSAARLALGGVEMGTLIPPSPGPIGPLLADGSGALDGAPSNTDASIDFAGDPAPLEAFLARQAAGAPTPPLRGTGGILPGTGPLPLWGRPLPLEGGEGPAGSDYDDEETRE